MKLDTNINISDNSVNLLLFPVICRDFKIPNLFIHMDHYSNVKLHNIF